MHSSPQPESNTAHSSAGDAAWPSTVEMHPAIIGDSPAMQRIRLQVRRLGPHFRIVLLRGEVGTGKELVAHALHNLSSHAAGRFVHLACSGGRHLETGMRGWLRTAHRGTLYLDQIDGLGIPLQGELLEALREREQAPIGPILVRGLEARIIASTAADLRAAAATGDFLQDLYRRIAAVEIVLPALRDRLEDIPALIQHFADRHHAPTPPQTLIRSLMERHGYRWPGNVEELEDIVRGTMAIEESNRPQGVPLKASHHAPPEIQASPMRLQEVVEQHVLHVLKECGGNKVRAAEVLGISRSTLYRMLEAGAQADKLSAQR